MVWCISARSVAILSLPPSAQELFLQPPVLVVRLGEDRGLRRLCSAAKAAAALPARAPKTRHLGERVRAQPVGPVDAHARRLSRRVQARERRGPVDVGVNAAHHVVNDRAVPGSSRSRDRCPRTSGTARARRGSSSRWSSGPGGGCPGGRSPRTGPRACAPSPAPSRKPARGGRAGPSSMDRSTGLGSGLPRS